MSVKELEIFAMATDPIYIGTGGYTIGRVDNTIVRDPITNVPKIPGSSLAGTWRYYVVIEAHKYFSSDEFRIKKGTRRNKDLAELFIDDAPEWIKNFEGNRFIGIKCAGQDEAPHKYFKELNESIEDTGHCGHCIACKGFGFSKNTISWQGMLFFSDLEIIFFPVFTIKGTKWITTKRLIEDTIKKDSSEKEIENVKNKKICCVHKELKEENAEYINLGWLHLPYKLNEDESLISKIEKIISAIPYNLNLEDIIIVPEDLFPHIVNSNLEVRTSVSIDPITGAAKEGALFTSEAIPRGTIFYGNVRIFDKKGFEEIEEKLKPLPTTDMLRNALENSNHFYESLGIGGMTTRGFGRLIIDSPDFENGGS